jgi:hypothetical protein
MKNIFLFLAVFVAATGSGFAAGAEHDWNLGATGLRGSMHCDKLVTTDARDITITRVETGSPADGVFVVGDSILGVDGKPFSQDPRTEMGRALTLAESEAGEGDLHLTRSREGRSEGVVLKLPVLGTIAPPLPTTARSPSAFSKKGAGRWRRGWRSLPMPSGSIPSLDRSMPSLSWPAATRAICRW